MATEQPIMTNGTDLLSLKAAAKRLDLPQSFLSWAVEGGFLQACRNAKGDWCLPAGEIEEGLKTLREEQASAKNRRLGAAQGLVASTASGGDDAAGRRQDTGRQTIPDPSLQASESRAGTDSELDYLRGLIKAQQASIDAKDSLIADLVRQMGRLSESALARLPAVGIPEEK